MKINDSQTKPIGVFDSGLGGLTVLKTLRQRFPHENFIYLGDTARIPYGTKSASTISKYAKQTLCYLKDQGVKAAVVACNTASGVIPEIRDELNMKIYEVITPGAQRAASATKTGVIGVIGTKGTIAKRGYVDALKRLNNDFKIYQQACPLLVPLVEEGWDEDPLTNLVIYRYLAPLIAVQIDTLILGCTHYPVLKNAISKVVGKHVELIDSSDAIADQMERDFQKNELVANHSGETAFLKMLMTDVSPSYDALAARIMSPLSITQFEQVDL